MKTRKAIYLRHDMVASEDRKRWERKVVQRVEVRVLAEAEGWFMIRFYRGGTKAVYKDEIEALDKPA